MIVLVPSICNRVQKYRDRVRGFSFNFGGFYFNSLDLIPTVVCITINNKRGFLYGMSLNSNGQGPRHLAFPRLEGPIGLSPSPLVELEI